MLFKCFKWCNYKFLIIYVLTAITCEGEASRNLTASEKQILRLARDVCNNLFYSLPKSQCIQSFLHPRQSPSLVVPEIRCRSEKTITLTVEPSEQHQLVVLVSEDGKRIEHGLIRPKANKSTIYTPSGRSTLWTTVLDGDGSPSTWRKGKVLDPWPEVQKEIKQKSYAVKFKFLYDMYERGTYFISAFFSWDAYDESDFCFTVFNSCNKKNQGDYFMKQISPDQARTVTVSGLPLDDRCSFRIIGKYGTTDLAYLTPSCYDVPGCVPVAEAVTNLTLAELQEENGMWSLHISWDPPNHVPDLYNITLNAEDVHAVTVPGNMSDVWFRNVRGEGLYEVTVDSCMDDCNSKRTEGTSRINIFPPRLVPVESSGVLTGSLWFVSLLAVSIFATGVVHWRRRLDYKRQHIYFPGMLEKISEEGDKDADGAEYGSEDQWEVRPDRLVLHEVIGEGAFGVVRKGTLAPTNKDVAVKMLKDFPSIDEIRSFRAEMELMKSVGAHPHVVSLVGCCSNRRPFIIAEYCSRGDLLSYLRCAWEVMTSKRNAKYYGKEAVDYQEYAKNKAKNPKLVVNRLYDLQGVCDSDLTLLDLLSFCRQIAMGMEFLASNRVVHRDLAARNILVTADRTLKIADFGLSRDIYQSNQYKQKGNGKMPVKWMALESLTRKIYTTQSDVWSFGVVMWEVVTVGGAPYAGVSAARLPRLLAAGYRMPRPPACSPALYEVMLSCWHARAGSRPSFPELHARLDALLGARAAHYLPLPADDLAPLAPLTNLTPIAPVPDPCRYMRMLFRGNRMFGHKSYERPHIVSNHYTTHPAFSGNDTSNEAIIKIY